MERMRNKDLENAWAVQGIRQEKCAKLEEENKKLKSDLSECECSMQFENDEVGYRKRECKKLKEIIRKAKEFEYDEDGMDYIYQNTEDIK